jgi:hypothetical protein
MRRSPSLVALPLVAGLLVVAALPVLAADPSPSVEPPHDPNTQVWQDEPLPPDVPEGRTIDVGFTIWDVQRKALSQVNSADVRVHPKTGKAKPTEAKTRSDWSGHVVASITIPKGGLGTIELGFSGQECHDDGTCRTIFLPFAWGGVGPPPEAPRSTLVDATIHPVVGPVVVGQPVDVDVDIAPRVGWDPKQLALPTTVVLIANQLNGAATSQSDMRLVNEGQYTATIILGAPGDTVMTVGFQTGDELDPIDRSALRLRVLPADGGATPVPSRAPGGSAPAPASSGGPDVPVVPIAIGLGVLIAGGYAIRRALADL